MKDKPQFVALLSEQDLEMARFAERDDKFRHAYVAMLKDNRLAATDGHIAAVLRRTPLDVEEFPKRPGLEPSHWDASLDAFVLPVGVCDQARKALPKKTTLQVLRHAALWVGTDRAALYVTDLDGWREFGWWLDHGYVFPNLKVAWPVEFEQQDLVSFDAKLMERANAAAQAVLGSNKKQMQPLAWRFRHGLTAEFFAEREGRELRGLLCQMKYEAEPKWGFE